jgi:hypothetical protein
MFDEVQQSIKNVIDNITTCTVGSIPSSGGFSVYLGSGSPTKHLDNSLLFNITVAINAKSTNLQDMLQKYSLILKALNKHKDNGTTWQILDVVTTNSPSYVDRDLSTKEWLYNALVEMQVYIHE